MAACLMLTLFVGSCRRHARYISAAFGKDHWPTQSVDVKPYVHIPDYVIYILGGSQVYYRGL